MSYVSILHPGRTRTSKILCHRQRGEGDEEKKNLAVHMGCHLPGGWYGLSMLSCLAKHADDDGVVCAPPHHWGCSC